MDTMKQIEKISSNGRYMVSLLSLASSPVGVRLLRKGDDWGDALQLETHRYCQALMKARMGRNVVLLPEDLSCPAAAAAFGFKHLPEGLQSGKGLVGFGIVRDPAVGKAMFENMPHLDTGAITGLHLFPLEEASHIPDVVVVEDEVERLMWIALASLHVHGGERVTASTAILQATCVDSTIIPYLENRINLSYGCYGCRDATDIGPSEAVLGFPARDLQPIVEHLKYLAEKAIPAFRSKKAFGALHRKEGHDCSREKTGADHEGDDVRLNTGHITEKGNHHA